MKSNVMMEDKGRYETNWKTLQRKRMIDNNDYYLKITECCTHLYFSHVKKTNERKKKVND